MALGLAVTTFKVQGLTLYRFLPLAVAFLARKLTGDIVEPEGGPATIPPWTARSQGRQVTLAIRDAEGRPIIYQEEVHTGVRRHGEAVPTELRSRVKP
jgi:hypothetical protein